MNSILSKTHLYEKRYGDKTKEDEKEIRLNTKKHKKQNNKAKKK